MLAFTPISSWTNGGQGGDNANEIISSYFDHRKVLSQSLSDYSLLTNAMDAQRVFNNPSWGGDGQGKNVFQEIQEWLETYCTSFLNTSNVGASSFLNEDKTEFVYYTKATWQAAAGLNVSDVPFGSFRRKVNIDDEWSYGTSIGAFLPGDIRGPWCFEDIQNGLKALKWTKQGGAYSYPQETSKSLDWRHFLYQELEAGHPEWPTLEEVREGFITGFLSLGWTGSGTSNMGYLVSASDAPGYDWGWAFSAARINSTWSLSFPAVNRKCDIYLALMDDANFYDFDNTELIKGRYSFLKSVSETSDTTVEVPIFSITDNCPITLLPSIPGSGVIRSGLNWPTCIMKWQFTYGED